MKKLIAIGLVVAALTVTAPASADTITITSASDGVDPNPTLTAGDYTVAGNDTASSPGQVNEVLFGPPPNNDATVSGSNTLTIAEIWNILNDGGVASTTSLYLAFGNNQEGSGDNQTTTITQLDIEISGTETNDDSWSLIDDVVAVVNFQGGQNTAEAIFGIGLGYDFMSIFDGSSSGNFTITSTYTGNNDGFEIYFFDPQFFPAGPPCPPGSDNEEPPCDDVVSVPEPGTLGLLGFGLLGLGLRRRRKV